MKKKMPHPLALIILDGWGYREQTKANAIAAAKKPVWDLLWKETTHTLISGSGKCVGLPDGQMGNSEVGHLNMGAGRIVHQELTRIDIAIENRDFFTNKALVEALLSAKASHKAVHVLGLLSPGGVHSHEKHIYALIALASQLKIPTVYLHPFLDGRDTPPRSAKASLASLEAHCREKQCGEIVSMIGRYYAMDRDNAGNRIQEAYQLIVSGKAKYHASTALEGLELAYKRGENDEFVKATSIQPERNKRVTVENGDVVIFINFRADRARELTQAFIRS